MGKLEFVINSAREFLAKCVSAVIVISLIAAILPLGDNRPEARSALTFDQSYPYVVKIEAMASLSQWGRELLANSPEPHTPEQGERVPESLIYTLVAVANTTSASANSTSYNVAGLNFSVSESKPSPQVS